jgi:hypothetical protein
VEVSINPDMCGQTLTREIELIEDRLTLSSEGGGTAARMIWERC